jgi:formate-dependent nitrite reductase membrane component NrfD
MTEPAQHRPPERQRRRRRSDPNAVVPDAEFTSYYGRPIVKASPWKADIPAYFFLGGLAAGSSAFAAGAAVTGRPALRRLSRLSALGAISASAFALIHDLGRPERFYMMLRVAKPTSPMSMGTWLVTAYAPCAGLAAAGEFASVLPLPDPMKRLLASLANPAGWAAAALAPALATYTGVLLADTATPTWKEAGGTITAAFAAGALASGAGMGLFAPLEESGPARRLAIAPTAGEVGAVFRMEKAAGLAGETFTDGRAGKFGRAAEVLLVSGGILAAVTRRTRIGSAIAGTALMAGACCERFAIFEAGQASARDPKYTVVPQRERMNQRERLTDAERPAQ